MEWNDLEWSGMKNVLEGSGTRWNKTEKENKWVGLSGVHDITPPRDFIVLDENRQSGREAKIEAEICRGAEGWRRWKSSTMACALTRFDAGSQVSSAAVYPFQLTKYSSFLVG